MDIPNIMSIREMIDITFGDSHINVVNYKLMQTILIILARQLGLLERRIKVEIDPASEVSSATRLSVTDVILYGNVPREKKDKVAFGTKKPTNYKTGMQEETLTSSAKTTVPTSVDSHDKTSLTAKKCSTDRPTSENTSNETLSSLGTTSTNKSTIENFGSDKTSPLETSSNKASLDKTGLEITSSVNTSHTSVDYHDEASFTANKCSTDRSTSDNTSNEILSLLGTTSTNKSTIEKFGSDKTSILETSSNKISLDKTGLEKTSSVNTSTEKPSSKIIFFANESTTPYYLDKTSAENSESTAKPSHTNQQSTDKRLSISTKLSLQDRQKLLQTIEEQREQELRVIIQRINSRQESNKTPTPMVSMESTERQYETLLLVERMPSDGTKATDSLSGKEPQSSIVTQDEFAELATIVSQLQDAFKIACNSDSPENAQLLNDLRKEASLTDAMAALQLSARLEATEKSLQKMLPFVTGLVSKTTGKNVENLLEKSQETNSNNAEITANDIFGAFSALSQAVIANRKSTEATEAPSKPNTTKVLKFTSKESITSGTQVGDDLAQETPAPKKLKGNPKPITHKELDIALQELYDECLKTVSNLTYRINADANNALNICYKIEETLDESVDFNYRIIDLEIIVSEIAYQITKLDTELSSQMIDYQEQLTQMQYDLDSGLGTMTEVLAHSGNDTAAVAELSNRLKNLHTDIETAALRRKKLKHMLYDLAVDLGSVWNQIEILRDTKSDRDEVVDALRDKAGLDTLNGLVFRHEYDAVRGDFEKRIGITYEKFDNQEIAWQEAIDDLNIELKNKADWIQFISLQGSINPNLDKLRAQIRAIEEVVREPLAAAVTKKLYREVECLSCASKALTDVEKSKTVPSLPAVLSPRLPGMGAEAKSKLTENGVHRGICYPGLPVPHAVIPRHHACNRFCGGSHTLINNKISHPPVDIIISPIVRQPNTAFGIDGKLYKTDENKDQKTLSYNCNKINTPELLKAKPAPDQEGFTSGTTPGNFQQSKRAEPIGQATGASAIVCVPPPPPMDDE